MTIKKHGCFGHIFAALDAVNELQRAHGFTADDVAAVHVGGYAATKNVCDRVDARTEQECRFSTQFTVATMLLHGAVRLSAFDEARLSDPAIRAVMPRITVSQDAECEAAFPAQRSAKVTIRLRSGQEFFQFQPTRKGDPDAPLTDQDLSEKFLELVGPETGSEAAAALLDALWKGSALPGLVPLRA